MLSYRHSFHAGNHADVLKHITISLIVTALKKKEKPFSYIESHSGAGLYDLKSGHSLKTNEFKCGILRLWDIDNTFIALKPYIETIKSLNPADLNLYPGSPLIAKMLLRDKDKISLSELHPKDFESLKSNFKHRKKTVIQKIDGYKFINSQIPPKENRGIVVIDPSYEIKTEYTNCITSILQLYSKWNTGIYCLWYPVIKRANIDQMYHRLLQSNIKKILQIELLIRDDNNDIGMTGSGLFIINPPWKIDQEFQKILPILKDKMAPEQGSYTIDWLSSE